MTDRIIAQFELEHKQGLILALAMVNASVDVILAMSELAGLKMTSEQGKYLRGPVMHSNSPWAADTPTWLTQHVSHARLTQIFSEGENSYPLLATPLEVTIVMKASALENPLHDEWVNVMTWAAHQAYQVYGPGGISEQAWREIAPEQLTPYEQTQCYNRIATDIRARAVKHAPKEVKAAKRVKMADLPPLGMSWQFDPETGGLKLGRVPFEDKFTLDPITGGLKLR